MTNNKQTFGRDQLVGVVVVLHLLRPINWHLVQVIKLGFDIFIWNNYCFDFQRSSNPPRIAKRYSLSNSEESARPATAAATTATPATTSSYKIWSNFLLFLIIYYWSFLKSLAIDIQMQKKNKPELCQVFLLDLV